MVLLIYIKIDKLTGLQRAKHVKMRKGTSKLLNDSKCRIISKIVTGDGMYMVFIDVPTR